MEKLEQESTQNSLVSALTTLLSFLMPQQEKDELKEESMIPSSLSLAYRIYRFCKKLPEQEFQEMVNQGE